MEQALETGKQQDVLELAQWPQVSCALCYSRLWADNGKTYTHVAYSLLSPARTATTRLLPGRAEQHLAGQIFSGLTRFIIIPSARLAI